MFPVHSFPTLINSALNVIDGICHNPRRKAAKQVSVPSYIEKNLLGNQRILFVTTREKLSLIAHLALALSSKGIQRDTFFNGGFDELAWAGVADAVRMLRDSIQSVGLEVCPDEIGNVATLIDVDVVPPVDIVIIDAGLPFAEELEHFFKMNVNRFSNESLRCGVFVRNFLGYSDLIM